LAGIAMPWREYQSMLPCNINSFFLWLSIGENYAMLWAKFAAIKVTEGSDRWSTAFNKAKQNR